MNRPTPLTTRHVLALIAAIVVTILAPALAGAAPEGQLT
jgi:hypothetical protein